MGKKIEFKDQYKHPKWQKKRLEILELNNYTCKACGDTEEQLHVHHGYYQRGKMLWEYENMSLWCLCKSCHEDWDEKKIELHRVLSYFNMKNYTLMENIISSAIHLQIGDGYE